MSPEARARQTIDALLAAISAIYRLIKFREERIAQHLLAECAEVAEELRAYLAQAFSRLPAGASSQGRLQ